MTFNPNRVRTSPNAKATIPTIATVMPAHVYPNMKTATANYAEASARMKAANTAAFKAEQKAAAALKDFLEIEKQYKAAQAEYVKYTQI